MSAKTAGRSSSLQRSPLHWPAGKGHEEVAKLPVTNGTNVNARNRYGYTPLDVAAEKGHTKIVELLRNHAARG
jgi:ankyrin repeat protein